MDSLRRPYKCPGPLPTYPDEEEDELNSDIVFYIELCEPHPAYTFCSSTSRNIDTGDDSDDLPFLPYSDDPSFDHLSYSLEFSRLAWQERYDPDVEVRNVHAVRTMLEEGKTRFQIIEAGISPKALDKMLSRTGAIRRDYPNWPPNNPLHPSNVPYSSPYVNDGPKEIYNRILQYFCRNRNCMRTFCDVHLGEMPVPPAIAPTLTNEVLYRTVDEPCGSNCFLLGSSTSAALSIWSDEDQETLEFTLKYDPDSLPCDISVILRKPCVEVARKRGRWLSKQVLSKKPVSKSGQSSKIKYRDFSPEDYHPNNPCSHSGPCDETTSCPCFKNNAYCIGACSCSKACSRKWIGCRCSQSSVNATCTTRCPCYKNRRECDPDLCLSCKARYFNDLMKISFGLMRVDPKTTCKNVAIQRENYKRGFVHRSKWGMGYFIAEKVKAGDLIGEYVGDLIFEETTKTRDVVAAHMGRQYMFALDHLQTIDSTRSGNETRYINHAPEDHANVLAQVWFVNGEHRIGIYANQDIIAGAELFLDYGKEFFHGLQGSYRLHQTPGGKSNEKVKVKVNEGSVDQNQDQGSPKPKSKSKLNSKALTEKLETRIGGSKEEEKSFNVDVLDVNDVDGTSQSSDSDYQYSEERSTDLD